MFQDKIAVTYTGNGSSVSSTTGVYNGDTDAGINNTIAAGATVEFDCTFPHTIATSGTGLGLQSWILASDQPVMVKTNDLTTPGNTFTIAPNSPKVGGWDWPAAAFVSADVTKVFVINAGTVPAKVNLRVLYNTGH